MRRSSLVFYFSPQFDFYVDVPPLFTSDDRQRDAGKHSIKNKDGTTNEQMTHVKRRNIMVEVSKETKKHDAAIQRSRGVRLLVLAVFPCR